MIAGMVPMALGTGEGGEQTAPLGRAVVGGLIFTSFTTLLILPAIFAMVMGRSGVGSSSLHPDDPESPYFSHAALPIGAHTPAVHQSASENIDDAIFPLEDLDPPAEENKTS